MKHYFFALITVLLFLSFESKAVEKTEFLSKNFSIIEMPFFAKNLIWYCKEDTTFLEDLLIKDKDRTRTDIKSYDLYINDLCSKLLVDSLKKYRNDENSIVVDSLIHIIPQHEIGEREFKWNELYHTGYDYDYYGFDKYVLFVLLYKGDNELKPLIEIEEGTLWREGVLLDFKHGEKIITNSDESNNVIRELEENINKYLIDKWSKSRLKESKELVLSLKEASILLKEKISKPELFLNGKWTGNIKGKEIVVDVKTKDGLAYLTYRIGDSEIKELITRYYDYGVAITSDLYHIKSDFRFKLSKKSGMIVYIKNSVSNKLKKEK